MGGFDESGKQKTLVLCRVCKKQPISGILPVLGLPGDYQDYGGFGRGFDDDRDNGAGDGVCRAYDNLSNNNR